MQRSDASRHHAYPAHRNGAGRMAGGPWPKIIERAQRRHEPAKLPRLQRIRARAIRARPFQLHVAVSNATVSTAPYRAALERFSAFRLQRVMLSEAKHL